MATVTYEELHLQNLVTIDYSSVVSNFRTIDSFIKNFASFQKKIAEMDKSQKITAQDLANFKMSTANTFSTMNQILESRGSMSKGSNKAMEEDMNEVKKSVKELKLFVTDSMKDVHIALQEKEKQGEAIHKKMDFKFEQLAVAERSDKIRMQSLENELYLVKEKYALRTDFQILRTKLVAAREQINKAREDIESTNSFLNGLGVKQFKEVLDKMSKQLYQDMDGLKSKFKLKTDLSDTFRLQEMMLNMLNFSSESVAKRYANKGETKKALIFLQKKMNAIIQSLMGDDGEKEGLVAAKGWKCISCSKDLGDYEGKLDQFKAWSVFPAKQAKEGGNKEKYNGFGTGFQSIIETAVTKKGGDIGYDDKGRMTTPFNLTRQVRVSLKKSQSQSKIGKDLRGSPVKGLVESNFMASFGRSAEAEIDIWAQYLQKEKGGLKSILKKQT